MAFYLGRRKQGDLILFRSAQPPTKESHGHHFTSVIGPFKSKVGANYYARYGQANPRLRNAEDAECLARADPRMEQAIVEEGMNNEELASARECEALDQLEANPNHHPITAEGAGCALRFFQGASHDHSVSSHDRETLVSSQFVGELSLPA